MSPKRPKRSVLFERKTRRLVVRPLVSSDDLAWKAAYSTMLPKRNAFDPTNRKPRELSVRRFRADLKSRNEGMAADRYYGFGVFHRKSGELVGQVGIMDVQRGISQSAYLGYVIFNRYWNQGFGKEAVRAAVDIAFRDLRLHRVEAGIRPRNRRSILLARSLGFRKEGLKKRAVLMHGEWVDLVMYSATTEDFGIRWRGRVDQR
ncbi:MAG: GNAT family N-acetyltransferase [Oligoflexia bacterium]|nr:GNAT family N-acetyltransferase [Oligoflexia bacterium]